MPHILVGVTSAQTCLVLPDRLSALRSAGFRVSLLSSPGGLAARASQINGVTAYTVPIRRSISLVSDIVAFLRICALLRRVKPDIVEFSTPKAALLGCVAAWLCGIEVRVYFLRGLRLETATGIKRRVLLYGERVAFKCAHVALCNSQSLFDRAREMKIAAGSKLILLGEGSSMGVDLERFSPGTSDVRQQFGIPQNAPVIGFVGRLTADKGVPELLEAFALILRRHPEAYLLLVGWFDAAEDALDCGIRKRIEGHPRIVLTGYVNDASPYYRAMDQLVLPSWREGFPNAILEAAASGVPVIAAACTGSRDAVIPGVTGLLVPAGSPEAISQAVLSLLSDDEVRRRMSEAARKWAVEHYDNRHVMRLMVRFYERLFQATSIRGSAKNRREPATGLPASL